MKKLIFESKYASVTYEDEKKIFEIVYHEETGNMSNQEWKDLMYSFKELWNKYETHYMISDDRDRKFGYDPDIQEWTLQLVIPEWNKLGLKKYVQILPKDFISSLSSEQIDELGNTKFSPYFENSFVKDYETAIKWLNIK